MNKKYRLFSFTFLLLVSLCCHTPADAKHMYIYKDKQGSTLLTNKKHQQNSYTQVKATYYADSNIHQYSNWGASESSVLPSFSKQRNAYDDIIHAAAAEHRLSAGLIKAVMHTESGFNPNARSPVGAQGLMQLMPATAQRFKVRDAFNPTENIYAGAKYLSWLLRRFDGNTQLALAAYNAGENNVSKYGGIPPFRETQDYVQRVMHRYQHLYANQQGLISSAGSNPAPVSQPLALNTPKAAEASKRKIVSINGVYTDRAVAQDADH